MFKKLFSSLSLIAVSFSFLPSSFAAVIDNDVLIESIDFIGSNSINPSQGEVIRIRMDFQDGNDNLELSFGYIKVKKGNQEIRTLANWLEESPVLEITWDGKLGCDNVCADGEYIIEAHVEYTDPSNPENTISDTDTTVMFIDSSNFEVVSFTVTASKGGNFDPAEDAGNEDLEISYSLSEAPQVVEIEIREENNNLIKTFNSGNQSHTFVWDGIFQNKLILPGNYKVKLTATKSGTATLTETKNFTVEYHSANKADITDFTINPSSFDPEIGDTTIRFFNDARANIHVEIRNSEGIIIRTFNQFDGDEIPANRNNQIVWNGQNNSGRNVATGNYKVVIVTRNTYGVVVAERNITINDSGNSFVSSNAHISNISCKPSVFKPGVDEYMECEADTRVDDLDVGVVAVRGNIEVELFEEDRLEKGKDVIQFEWDGTDKDDEYVDPGTWRIEFRSKKDSTELMAGITKTIRYDAPGIDDFVINKREIDPELDEVAYALFKIDMDAEVYLYILENGNRDEEIVEEMEVEANRWYVVEIDASGYDYNDDIEIELVAANAANKDVNSKRRLDLDLKEDIVSSSKSNVTRDYISPVISDCEENIEIGYDLEDRADVVISIHRGKTASGSKVVELINLKDQAKGQHSIIWNCRDANEAKLAKGFYTYKIVSMDRSSDTESGIFLITDELGDVGKPRGGNNDVNPNVVIIGESGDDNNTPPSDNIPCAGFTDVTIGNSSCDAIRWAKNAGIFRGYANGSFGFYQPINRVEFLKVIIESLSINSDEMPLGTLGFNDVESGSWYMPYINSAKNLGIFHGDGGMNTARPADSVNKVEALKMAFESVRNVNGYTPSGCVENLVDVGPSDWYFNYACESERFNLFNGVGNIFVPGKKLTRGEVVEMLYRMHVAGLL